MVAPLPHAEEPRVARSARSSKRAAEEIRAVDPIAVKVASMVDALGSQATVAKRLGVSRGQPGRWMTGAERPSRAVHRRITDFDYVWDRLTAVRSPEVAHIWLDSPNAFLGGASPSTWLSQHGTAEVVAALDAEEAGSFA